MRLTRRRPQVPDPVRAAVALAAGERLLAAAAAAEGHVVLSTHRLVAVSGPNQAVSVNRGWHEVDAGQWDADTWTLSVSFVGGTAMHQWQLTDCDQRLPEAFRERVQASILAVEPLGLAGARQAGRVVLRRNLATGEVFVQPVLGRGTSASDPAVAAAVTTVSAFLAEQAGVDAPLR